MKSQFAGIILFSLILVFVISFGHINPVVSFDSEMPFGPENMLLMTSYYVAPTPAGDDIGGTGTIENPWATISHAMGELSEVSGYTLNVAAGTYDDHFSVSNSGDVTQKNEIIGYGGDVTLSPTSESYVIKIDGKSNIKISGLTVTSSTSHGVYVHGNSDNIELTDITVSSVGSGEDSGIFIEGTDANAHPDVVTISDCTVAGDYNGISIYNCCTYVTIENSTINDCESSAVFISSNCEDCSIDNNIISVSACSNAIKATSNCNNLYITSNDIDVTTGEYGIYFDDISNPILINNMIDGSYSNAIVYDKDSDNFSMNFNTLRNKSASEGVIGYHGYRSVSSLSSYAYSFHNNIISLLTNYGYVMFVQGNETYWLPEYANRISNNLYYNGLYCGCYGGTNLSTLSQWQSALGVDYDANSISEDPEFVSTSDLHINPTSPCFGAGVSIGGISNDIDGHERNPSNPNIGADEFDSLTIASGESITISWNQVEINATIAEGGTLNLTGDASGIDVKFGTLDVYGYMFVTGTVVVKSTTLNVYSGGEIEVGDLGIEIRAIDLTVDTGGKITADGNGYAAGEGPGAGTDCVSSGAGGGAYGGNGATGGGVSGGSGGLKTGYTTDNLYFYPHHELGSGGGNGNNTAGGNGGGAIYIEVFDTLTVDGLISANGDDGGTSISSPDTGAGGGGGGGISMCAREFVGSGVISANGGAGGDGYNDNDGGAGGAGFQFIISLISSFTGTVTANKGTKANGCPYDAEDTTPFCREFPGNFKKCPCVEPHIATFPGPAGNELINYPNLGLIADYQLTYLNFADNVSRNFTMYYGSNNGIERNQGVSYHGSGTLNTETFFSTNNSLKYNERDDVKLCSYSPASSDGWTHSFNENLEIDGIVIIHMMQCGQSAMFVDEDADSIFEPAPFYGEIGKIVYDSVASEYTLEEIDGSIKVFDSNGVWLYYSDCNGNTMTLNYDGSDRLSFVEYPDGRALKINYDDGTEISSIECYESVVSGVPSGLISDSGESNFRYDNNQLVEAGKWDFEYDVLSGKLEKQKLEYESSEFRVTEFEINDIGECTSIKDSQNETIEFSQEKLDHETTVKDRSETEWKCKWDYLKDVITQTTDPLGNKWYFKYDDNRNLLELITPAYNDSAYHTQIEYTYDENNNLTSVKNIDSNNASHYVYSEYNYDNYNNVISEKGPYFGATSGSEIDKTEVQYDYYCNGLIDCSGTLVQGTGTCFLSDLIVGGTITSDGETRTVTSIASDSLCTVNSSLSVSNALFTSSRRLLKQIRSQTSNTPSYLTVDFEYNDNGQVTSVTYESGEADERQTRYSYYSYNDFSVGIFKGMVSATTIENGDNDFITNYRYTPQGFTKEITSPEGIITQYIYNLKGQVLYSCTNPSTDKLGLMFSYHNDGRVEWMRRGHYTSWNYATPSFDLSHEFEQFWFQYNDNGTLIAIKDRMNLGVVYEYNKENLITKMMQGQVDNFGSSNVEIYEGSAYSEETYQYLLNESLHSITTKLNTSENAVETYTYYDNGNLKEIFGPKYDSTNDMKMKFEYDFVDRVYKIYSSTNGTTYNVEEEYSYDSFGNVAWFEDETNKRVQYEYDDYTGNLTNVRVDPSGDNLTTSFTYNDYGQVVRYTKAAQSTTGQQIYKFFKYDSLGRLIERYTGDDPNEILDNGVFATTFSYDDNHGGRLYKKTLIDIEDGNDIDYEFFYDSLNRIEALCNDPGYLKEGLVFSYDFLSNVKQTDEVTFTSFSTSSYSIDDYLRTTASEFDSIGRQTKSILNPASESNDLEDITTYYGYDTLSRVTKVVDPQQWIDAYRDFDEKHTEYVYDHGGRLTEIKKHIGNQGNTIKSVAKYEYYENSSIKKERYTQNGSDWIDVVYDYQPTGLLNSITYPGYNDVDDEYEYSYYDNGQLRSVSIDSSEKFEYTYDDAGRLVSIEENSSGNLDKQFSYNDHSQIISIKDASSNERFAISYNEYGQIASTTDKTQDVFNTNNKSISYLYYKSGFRKEMNVDNSTYKLEYHYDNAGRLKQVNRWDGAEYDRLANYAYNGLGQRTGYTRYDNTGNSVVAHTEYEYLDEIGWLQMMDNRNQINSQGATSFSKYYFYDSSYGDGYDLLGNKTYIEDKDGNYTEYEYDDLYRLISETLRNSGDYQQAKYEFTYDDVGNRTSQKRYTTSGNWEKYIEYSYNDANQLTYLHDFTNYNKTAENKAIQYSYDDSGNLVEKNIDNAPTIGSYVYTDEEWEYGYDANNHLIQVNNQAGPVSNYTFNMVGNRVAKFVDATEVTTKMLYDDYSCVVDYDVNDVMQRYFVSPILDENILVYDDAGDDDDHYYLHDAQNSVVNIIDSSQNVDYSHKYEAFGTEKSSTGAGISDNRFLYTGREYDSETGLFYYRARMYDSTVGSFTGRDPIPYTNLYPYVNANPLNFLDPFGHRPVMPEVGPGGTDIDPNTGEPCDNPQGLDGTEIPDQTFDYKVKKSAVKYDKIADPNDLDNKVREEAEKLYPEKSNPYDPPRRRVDTTHAWSRLLGALWFLTVEAATSAIPVGKILSLGGKAAAIIFKAVAKPGGKIVAKVGARTAARAAARAAAKGTATGTVKGATKAATKNAGKTTANASKAAANNTSKTSKVVTKTSEAVNKPKCPKSAVQGQVDAPTQHNGLMKNMGFTSPIPGKHIHHGLPWNLRNRFAKYGIDVNDSKWGFILDPSHHLSMHGKGYNKDWADWLDKMGDNVTEEGALKFLNEMRSKWGF